MRFGHVALRDGHEAGDPRLRRQQVVERIVEPPRSFGVGGPIADGQQAATLVVQQPEVHLVGEASGALSELFEPRGVHGLRRRRLLERGDQFAQTAGERDQGGREVAAVDRRNIARRQRRQALGVVPVEEMAVESFEPFDCGQRPVDPCDEVAGVDESEIARGKGGEQTHADIGGRRAMRDHRRRRVLKIVRRQAVIVSAVEGFEISPRLPGELSQPFAILVADGQLPACHRPAERMREQWRDHPQHQDRQRRRQRARPQRRDRDQRRRGE